MARKVSTLQRVVSLRRLVQLGFGVSLYLAVTTLGIGLGWVILVASAMGVVLGKFFCRWMCPMGAMMEVILGADAANKHKSLYNYFKLGCPIAWAGGFLNRVSALRVTVDPSKCVDCGACDRACYVAQLAPGHSLHQAGKVNASTHYSCSRCLACVGACPTQAVGIGMAGPALIALRVPRRP